MATPERHRSRSEKQVSPSLSATETKRLGRLERPALAGVLKREIINFSSYWRSTTFSSTIEPTIYLLSFGFGIGALVSKIGNYPYIDFIGTGVVATAVMFSSAFPAMFGTFVKYQFQHTYDGLLAAPVDTEEIVTAEALWIATRAAVYGCVPILIAMIFGLPPKWSMFLVPFIGFLAGFGWALVGISIAATLNSIENFNYIISALLVPIFLLAGTFFPLTHWPQWVQGIAEVNPLHQCVELVRYVALGGASWIAVPRVVGLVLFAIAMWRLAIWRMEKRLID